MAAMVCSHFPQIMKGWEMMLPWNHLLCFYIYMDKTAVCVVMDFEIISDCVTKSK